MKKIFLILAIAGLVSCSKEKSEPAPQLVAVQFYSSNPYVLGRSVAVRVNGQLIGKLNFSDVVPKCGAAGFSGLLLAGGTYTAEKVETGVIGSVSFTVPKTAANCVFFDLK